MSDLASLFPGLDPAQIQGLLAQFQPSEEDKAKANKSAILQFGLGLLGSHKGEELQRFGLSGLNAMAGRQATLDDATKQRGLMLNQAMQMWQAQKQSAMGDAMMKALNGTPDSAPGPALPEGLVGGSGMGGGTASLFGQSSQPGPVSGPGMAPPPRNLRDNLANLNFASIAGGGKDFSGAIKTKFPDIIPLREGAGYIDPSTGKYTALPKPPPGYFYDPDTNSFRKVTNAAEAEAASAAIPHAVTAAFTPPSPRMDERGNEVVPPGNRLTQMFGNGPLPYGAPPQSRPNILTNLVNQPPNERAAMERDMQNPAAGMSSEPFNPVAANIVKQGPGAEREQAARGEDLGKMPGEIDTAAKQAQLASARSKEMRALFDTFSTGPLTGARQTAGGLAYGLGMPDNVTNRIAGGNLSAMYAAQKHVVNAAFDTTKALTSRPAQAEVILSATQGTANQLLPKPAITAILDYNDGVTRYLSDMQQAKDAWLKDPGHHNSMQGFSGAWNSLHPLDSYIPSVEKLQSVLGVKQPQQAGGKQYMGFSLSDLVKEAQRRGIQ